MSAGTWIVIGLLSAAFGGFIRIWTRTGPDEVEGVEILHRGWLHWRYLIEDKRHSLFSDRYLTRGAAIRAARAELERLKQRIGT